MDIGLNKHSLSRKAEKMKNEREIIISVSDKVPTETLFYIVDCWVEFVVCDLGLEPNDLMMILPDID